MKPESKSVPLGKASILVVLGFVSGFCAVLAFLTYSDSPHATIRIVALALGFVLSTLAAFGINRMT